MTRVMIQRLYQAVFVLLGASLVVFVLLHLTGGDIARSLINSDSATEAQIDRLRSQLALDLPIHEQYWKWITGVVQGDFGQSFRSGMPAMALVLERFPATVQLAVTAQLIAIALACPLGILAAVRRGSWWDRLSMSLALLGQSMPNFWLGLMLVLIVAVELRLLPVSGRESPQHLILPAITLAVAPLALLARLVRSGMLEILNQDYVRTAHAKGLPGRTVLTRHGLRNALLPLVTVIGLEFGSLLNGSVVIENVFAWPGVGQLLVSALHQRDIPVVEAGVFLVAAVYVGINLAVDLLYAYIDPRVRYS